MIPLLKAFLLKKTLTGDRLADHIRDQLDLEPFSKNLSLGGLS